MTPYRDRLNAGEYVDEGKPKPTQAQRRARSTTTESLSGLRGNEGSGKAKPRNGRRTRTRKS